MELQVVGRERTYLLIVAGAAEQEVRHDVAATIRSPTIGDEAAVVTGPQTACVLDVLAGIPVETKLRNVVADHFGEVIVDGRILLQTAEGAAVEASIKRKLFNVRAHTAPGCFEVRDLGSGVAEQTGNIES